MHARREAEALVHVACRLHAQVWHVVAKWHATQLGCRCMGTDAQECMQAVTRAYPQSLPSCASTPHRAGQSCRREVPAQALASTAFMALHARAWAWVGTGLGGRVKPRSRQLHPWHGRMGMRWDALNQHQPPCLQAAAPCTPDAAICVPKPTAAGRASVGRRSCRPVD